MQTSQPFTFTKIVNEDESKSEAAEESASSGLHPKRLSFPWLASSKIGLPVSRGASRLVALPEKSPRAP